MGIQIYTDRALDARDKRINEELQNKITTLEADAETQEATLKAKDVFIAVLKADKQHLEQEVTERFKTSTQLRKDVSARDERIRELEATMQSAGERHLQTMLSYNQARDTIKQLEAEAERYRADIVRLQGECLTLSAEKSRLQANIESLDTQLHETQMRELKRGDALDDLLALAHKIAQGVCIRTDKPGGKALVEQATALVWKYDSKDDKPKISDDKKGSSNVQ